MDVEREDLMREYLSREAYYFHRSLFKSEISKELADKYIKAHDFVKPSGTDSQFQTIRMVIDLNLDAEAVELALRKKNSQHPLLQKIKILTYLAECNSQYYDLFINEEPSLFKAVAVLTYHVLRTAYKLLKGNIVKLRYGLV